MAQGISDNLNESEESDNLNGSAAKGIEDILIETAIRKLNEGKADVTVVEGLNARLSHNDDVLAEQGKQIAGLQTKITAIEVKVAEPTSDDIRRLVGKVKSVADSKATIEQLNKKADQSELSRCWKKLGDVEKQVGKCSSSSRVDELATQLSETTKKVTAVENKISNNSSIKYADSQRVKDNQAVNACISSCAIILILTLAIWFIVYRPVSETLDKGSISWVYIVPLIVATILSVASLLEWCRHLVALDSDMWFAILVEAALLIFNLVAMWLFALNPTDEVSVARLVLLIAISVANVSVIVYKIWTMIDELVYDELYDLAPCVLFGTGFGCVVILGTFIIAGACHWL